MAVRIGHIEIFVEDSLKSMDFYTGILGFELEENQSGRYIWLKLGGQSVLLRPGKGSLRGDNTAAQILLLFYILII